MRGLIGVVSLDGLEPGMHALNVVWNPDPIEFFDDRYDDAELRYSIPSCSRRSSSARSTEGVRARA